MELFNYDRHKGEPNPGVLETAARTGVLHMDDVKSSLQFMDPRHGNIKNAQDPYSFRPIQCLIEHIDPDYSINDYVRYGRFRFGNDFRDEFGKQIKEYARYSNALEILEIYAVRRSYAEYRFPYFFDPISTRVRVTAIVGTRYFRSDNGYVCNADDYMYENEELRMRRKYILL